MWHDGEMPRPNGEENIGLSRGRSKIRCWWSNGCSADGGNATLGWVVVWVAITDGWVHFTEGMPDAGQETAEMVIWESREAVADWGIAVALGRGRCCGRAHYDREWLFHNGLIKGERER